MSYDINIKSLVDRAALLKQENDSLLQEVGRLRGVTSGNAKQTVSSFDGIAKKSNWHEEFFPTQSMFFKAVRECSTQNWTQHPKMRGYVEYYQKALPSGMNETSGADGGFLVPPQFVQQLLQRTYENDLLSRTTMFPMTSNTLAIPAINETSRANGSRFGGVQAYWRSEAGSTTNTQPGFSSVRLTLDSLMLTVRVTNELLEDSGMALETYISTVASQELQFKVGDSIVRGDGVDKPQGILYAPALITVNKRTGQTAATLTTENIVDMWSRMWIGSRPNSVWLINQDVESQLLTMTIGVGLGGQVTYMPPGGLSGAPYATLLGRPVIVTEFNSTLGTAGDILLVDLSQYLTGTKGGLQSAASMHVYFSTNEMLYRFIMRLDGRAWWTSALTPYQGSATKSPFIALQTRS